VTPRVVHLASGREWRGGQRQVWWLARALAQQGIGQVVVTGAGSELAQRLERDGIRVRAVPWSIGLDPRVLPGLVAELRAGPSLVHAHDAHAVTLGGLGAWLAGRSLVATRRVDFPLRRLGCWGRAARVIAISRAVADVLVADGIAPDRIAVVHSGIALEDLRQTPRLGIRDRLGIGPDTLIAANVAALVPHKDQATLLRSAALLAERLPALHWVIAGEGPQRPALQRLCAELGLDGRVHFLGHLQEPARLIADANCFVMSSREEGLGTSVLEAMALGTPVASTTAGGLPEMLHAGAGLLVPSADPAALAQAVARLVSEPTLAREVSLKGSIAVQGFTAERMAEAVATVYRSLVPFP
jgi:glycosyltransferase involved in cell wall biosynthesis